MAGKAYCLDRIEGEDGRKTAVFTAGNDETRPRMLFIPLPLAESAATAPLSEGGICRITFGEDGAVASIVPDPAASARTADALSTRLSSLFERGKRE